jgi:hypothetical protein
VCALASPSRADPTAEDKALAAMLFKEARELLEHDEIDKACRKFQESQRIDPSGGTLLNLAACFEKQGRIASAWAEFNEALAWARRDDRGDRVQYAYEQMKALEPRLSFVIVDATASAHLAGLEVRRNGTVVQRAAWGSRIPVDPGKHTIEASSQGYQPWRSEIVVQGQASEVRVVIPGLTLAPAPPERPAVAPAAEPKEPDRIAPPASSVPWSAYALAGVGVVGIGVGSYFGLRAFSKNDQADQECPRGACSDEGLELTDEAGTAADVSTVAFAVGVVALGAGATVWLLSGDDSEAQGARWTPTVGPGHASVSWSGRF